MTSAEGEVRLVETKRLLVVTLVVTIWVARILGIVEDRERNVPVVMEEERSCGAVIVCVTILEAVKLVKRELIAFTAAKDAVPRIFILPTVIEPLTERF